MITMKYYDSIIGIFVISVFSLALIIAGIYIADYLNISIYIIAIVFVLALIYSIFKLKDWHFALGLLLSLAYMMAFYFYAAYYISQIN